MLVEGLPFTLRNVVPAGAMKSGPSPLVFIVGSAIQRTSLRSRFPMSSPVLAARLTSCAVGMLLVDATGMSFGTRPWNSLSDQRSEESRHAWSSDCTQRGGDTGDSSVRSSTAPLSGESGIYCIVGSAGYQKSWGW